MAHDKIKAAARKRMAGTGEPYTRCAAAPRPGGGITLPLAVPVSAEHGAPGGDA